MTWENYFLILNITPVLGEENFPLKIHLEYDGTFTKLFMHVSSRNMFSTTRNLQIRVHSFGEGIGTAKFLRIHKTALIYKITVNAILESK
jgi:hypothetical protein